MAAHQFRGGQVEEMYHSGLLLGTNGPARSVKNYARCQWGACATGQAFVKNMGRRCSCGCTRVGFLICDSSKWRNRSVFGGFAASSGLKVTVALREFSGLSVMDLWLC